MKNKKSNQADNIMEKIVSLSKRRGFIYAGSEIYGGLANTYDYGPYGTEIKNNVKKLWWKYFVQNRNDMVGMDGGILMSPKIWEASGHVDKFKDPLVECKKCHKRYRPDKLSDSTKCPDCGGPFTPEKYFSGMFKTTIGPVEEEGLVTYLRPETAQAIFANYKNIQNSSAKKIPFGIGQMGKAFRNEITTGNFIFRTLEFEQMEIEYFISPKDDWKKIYEEWVDYMHDFLEVLGLKKKKLYDHEIPEDERAFYSKRTIDMEYKFPFGHDELWAIAYRTDYDLKNHQEKSGVDLTYFDTKTNERYIPHVIEPTFGVDRTVLAIMTDAYKEEEVNGSKRVVMKFHPNVAPVKIAVFPLLKNKPKLVKKAQEVFNKLNRNFVCEFDDNGNIGKRYRRHDEIGTPYCVTIDFDTLKDDTVTIRDRDTMEQERVEENKLGEYFSKKINS